MNGRDIANKRWSDVRRKTREAIVAKAIKTGQPAVGATDVIALGVAAMWTESLKGEHKLSDRIKAQRHVMGIATPGVLVDARQRDPGILPGGMRIDISQETMEQLVGTLLGSVGMVEPEAGYIGDGEAIRVVEGVSKVVEDDESTVE